jgi:hypothetical protein
MHKRWRKTKRHGKRAERNPGVAGGGPEMTVCRARRVLPTVSRARCPHVGRPTMGLSSSCPAPLCCLVHSTRGSARNVSAHVMRAPRLVRRTWGWGWSEGGGA